MLGKIFNLNGRTYKVIVRTSLVGNLEAALYVKGRLTIGEKFSKYGFIEIGAVEVDSPNIFTATNKCMTLI